MTLATVATVASVARVARVAKVAKVAITVVVVDLRTCSKSVKSCVTTFPFLLLRLHYPHHPRVIRHRTVPATIVVRVMLLPIVRGTIVVPTTIHPQNTTTHPNTTHRHHLPTPSILSMNHTLCMRKNRNVIPHRTVPATIAVPPTTHRYIIHPNIIPRHHRYQYQNVIRRRSASDPPAVRVIRLCTAVATIAVHVIPPRPVNPLVEIVVPEQNSPVKNASKFVKLYVAATAAIMVARVAKEEKEEKVVRVDTTADIVASVVM